MSQKLGLVPAEELDGPTLQSESYDGAKLCFEGDLVLNRLKAHLAVFSIAPCNGLVSPDYSVFRLQDDRYDSIFFENLFKTQMYITEFNRRVKGIVVGFYRLYSDSFKEIPCLIPPTEEQQQITKRISQITIHAKNMQARIELEIDTLKELKMVLVSDAVTGRMKLEGSSARMR